MKKTFKRVITMVLCLALVLSVSAFAMADDAESKAEIVFFGDSVTQAWGSDDFYFCQRVADGLGIDNSVFVTGTSSGVTVEKDGRTTNILDAKRVIYGNSGVRTYEALIALGAAEYDSTDTYYAAGSSEAQTMANEAVKNTVNYVKAVKSAKTIVIQTGSDDVLYYAQMQSNLLGALGNIDSMTTDDIAAVLGDYAACLAEGFANFSNDFPTLIERVMELKSEVGQVMGKDYNIVVVGAYNPVFGLKIINESATPVGDLISGITIAMNAKFNEWQETYGFCFAYIANVETGAMTGVNDTFIDFASISVHDSCIATHPSYTEGYDYIARQVLAALPQEKPVIDTNIRIDLGSVKSVSKVILGTAVLGKDSYSFDPETRILTVKTLIPSSTLFTVTSVGSDGRVYIATYQVSYSIKDGYSAYLMYSTVDLASTVSIVANNAAKVGKAAISAIKGLFAR